MLSPLLQTLSIDRIMGLALIMKLMSCVNKAASKPCRHVPGAVITLTGACQEYMINNPTKSGIIWSFGVDGPAVGTRPFMAM